MSNQILELQKLFINKEYSKLILIVENSIHEKDKSLSILNIYGASLILRGPKNRDIFEKAILNFKNSYLKDPNHISCLDSLINLINATCNLFNLRETGNNFFDKFNELIHFYKQAENLFGHHEKLVVAMIRIYKRLNYLDEILECHKKLTKNNTLRLNSAVSQIYNNCFCNEWSQKNFFIQSKLLEKFTPAFHEDKLSKIVSKPNNRIKIGFLSSDIKQKHSITFFLKTILTNYDKKKFEIVLFLNQTQDDDDPIYFKKLVDENFNISKIKDIDAINFIRNKNIDIMFDLMGITSKQRITLFKNRLAPIQITWLGYCNTTGLNNMDYLISDPHLIYSKEKDLYKEKIIYLKDIWNCHSGFDLEQKKNSLPFLKNKFITFGSFNNFRKINNNVLNVWSAILKNIKDSKLILKSSLKIDNTRIKETFKKKGVLESVIFYEKKSSNSDHLDLYKEIDLALDTFPYNGVTTSFESIWMGVPVLTMQGYNFNSRCGESINKNLNLDYLIAQDEEEYIFKANELANDKNKLIELRNYIFDNSMNSPLFNQKNFSKDFFSSIEDVYKKS